MNALGSLLVLGLAAAAVADPLARARQLAAPLPAPPGPADLAAADASTRASWAEARRALFDEVAARVPVAPPGADPAPLLQAGSVEDPAPLLIQLRFLALLELRQGRVTEACRAALRSLRLAVDLGRVAEDGDTLRVALALEAAAYQDLTRGLLTGALDSERLRKLGALLGAWLRAWPAGSRLPALVAARRRSFEARRDLPPDLASLLSRYLDGVARVAAQARPMRAEVRIEAAAQDLLARHGARLEGLADPPLLRGVGARLARVEAAQAMAVSAVALALARAGSRRWPRDGREAAASLGRDPLSGESLGYLLVAGEPALVSAGLDGRLDGGRVPEDMVVGSEGLMARIEAAREAAVSFPVAVVERLQVPQGDRDGPPEVPAGDCAALRRDLEVARLDLERELQVELADDPETLLPVLRSQGFHAGAARCPDGGLWRLHSGRWACTRHPSGYDPRPSLEDEELTQLVCQQRRQDEVPAIVRFHREVDRDLSREGRDYRVLLVSRGYLTTGPGCPSQSGTWSLGPQGLVCSRHLQAVRVPPKGD